jgi:hypothetical protein
MLLRERLTEYYTHEMWHLDEIEPGFENRFHRVEYTDIIF